jgi:hypothetical protein
VAPSAEVDGLTNAGITEKRLTYGQFEIKPLHLLKIECGRLKRTHPGFAAGASYQIVLRRSLAFSDGTKQIDDLAAVLIKCV